jgi:hypothetical protein
LGIGRWIQILVNNGDGTFRDETESRLPQADNNAATYIKYLRLVDLNGDGAVDLIGQLEPHGNEPPPVYLNGGGGSFTALPLGYGGTADDLFTLVDARRIGRRDFFTIGLMPASPGARFDVVPQTSRTLRPGTPAAPTVGRTDQGVIVSWPYEWGAVTYEVCGHVPPAARAPGSQRYG